MTLFHPKLRKALLNDPEHKAAGLNAHLLLDYEVNVAQLFYVTHFPGEQPPREELLGVIRNFRNTYLPNFDRIHEKWVEGQKRAINRRHHFFFPVWLQKVFSSREENLQRDRPDRDKDRE